MQINKTGFRAFPNTAQLGVDLRVELVAGVLALAGATSAGLGTLPVRLETTDVAGTVQTWNTPGSRFMIAAGVIADQALVYAAASGKVAATGSVLIGRNIGGAASADGDQIEVLPIVGPGAISYANVAASATITNTTTETAFDQSFTFPANSLKVGDRIKIKAQAIAPTTNGTDTLNLRLKIGSTTIIATGAVDVANNDIGYIEAELVVRTVGAGGTFVATGTQALGVPGTVTAKPFLLGSTAIDTTAAQAITVTGQWSAASASDIVRLDVLTVEKITP